MCLYVSLWLEADALEVVFEFNGCETPYVDIKDEVGNDQGDALAVRRLSGDGILNPVWNAMWDALQKPNGRSGGGPGKLNCEVEVPSWYHAYVGLGDRELGALRLKPER
eukprot:Gb_22300 [translate_table: standard]